jgi:tetratricopeptide (TPR) repeat protein/predicted transcriptional regulator/ABC-type cobalamin/Fe3+-siderophores transport system ATPase subunit
MTEGGREYSLPEFMRVVGKRGDLLERLTTTAADKRDLVAEFDYSRSTIDRSIRALADEGLVTCEDGEYEATAAGAIAVRAYQQFVGLAKDIDDARKLLTQLSAEEPLEPMLFDGADVTLAAEHPRVELFAPIERRLREADAISAILPALADSSHLEICRQRAATGAQVELVVSPTLYETLQTQRARTLRQLGEVDACTCHVADPPPCGLIFTERAGEATATVVLFDGGQVVGTITNDTRHVLAWAREQVAALLERGRDVTDELRELSVPPTATSKTAHVGTRQPRVPQPVRADGFIRLTPAYFNRREPVDPATAYRSGLGLVEVAAGYAAERTLGDATQRVTDRLTNTLTAGGAAAVVGPPGVGKTTVCKQVAYRWYEANRGPVIYRSEAAKGRLRHPDALCEFARSVEGHALVVVEGATTADPQPVLDLAGAAAETDANVSVLLEARHSQWARLKPTDGIELVRLSEIDETDCARLIETVQSLRESAELPAASDLLATGQQTTHEAAVDAGVTLGVIHRLATLLDPLSTGKSGHQTPLVADVEAALEATTTADAAVFDIALAVQACIIADQPVSVDLLYALDEDPQTVDTAIEVLTGRALFPPVTDGTYRTVHASWAATFLGRALDHQEPATIHDRLMDRLSTLLALADEPAARDRLRTFVGGATPLVARIDANPGRWADDCIKRLHTAAIAYPKIAPAFSSGEGLTLPAAASEGLGLLDRYRQAQAAERGGDFDRALATLTTLNEEIADGATPPPRFTRAELARRTEFLSGRIHRNQGNLATAAERLTAVLEDADAADQDILAARCRYELGDIARQRGDLEKAEHLFDVCRAHESPQLRAQGLRGLGRVAHIRGNYETAARHLEEALAIDERRGARKGMLQTLNVLGANAYVRGNLDTAGEHFRRSIEVARRLGTTKTEAEALNNLGEVYWAQGDHETAREYYEHGLETARTVGVSRSVAIALCNLGQVQCAEGAHERARKRFEEALSVSERLDSPKLRLHATRGLATVAKAIGEYATAIDQYDRARAVAEELGNERVAATVQVERAAAVAANGDRQQALTELEAVLSTVESPAVLTEVLDSVAELLDTCLDVADADRAAAVCRDAIEIATAADQPDRIDAFERRLTEFEA